MKKVDLVELDEQEKSVALRLLASCLSVTCRSGFYWCNAEFSEEHNTENTYSCKFKDENKTEQMFIINPNSVIQQLVVNDESCIFVIDGTHLLCTSRAV